MKNTRKLLVGVLAAAGIAGAAAVTYADPPGGYGPGAMGYGPWGGGHAGPDMMGGGHMGPGMMGGWGPRGGFGPGAGMMGGPVSHQEARLAFLKSELRITPEQETAWSAYATQAKAQAAAMEAFHAQRPGAAQSAPERLDQRAEFAKQRAEQVKAMSTAVKDLYAVLTPEQKSTADRYFGGMHLSQRGPGR